MASVKGPGRAATALLFILLCACLPSCTSYQEHVTPLSGETLQPGYARIERWQQIDSYKLEIDVACAIVSNDRADSARTFLYRVDVEPDRVFDAVDTNGRPVELEDWLARFRREHPEIGCILTQDILLRAEPSADGARIEVYRTYVGLVDKAQVRDLTLRSDASWIRTPAQR